MAIFLLTDFSFVHKIQNMWTGSCQPGSSLSHICRPGCSIFSTQALLLCVPLTGKLCIAPPLLIWSSPSGRQFVSSGVSLLKHKQGGSSGQHRWRRPNETQAAAALNSYNKDSSAFKEERVLWKLCCSAAETFHSVKHKNLLSHPLSSIGLYFLWAGFLTNILEDVSQPTSC